MKKTILKFFNQLNKLSVLQNNLEQLNLKVEDNYSFHLLQSLLVDHKYLPLNGGSLRPMGIAYILNEIVINKRKKILEFGAGITTILLARLIKKNNLKIQFYSIEHNQEWILYLKKLLNDEGLSDLVIFIHSDLIEYPNMKNSLWYDENLLNKQFDHMNFDFVIIDGPPANIPEIQFSRCPVINFLKNKLEKNFCIFLDDVDRVGERKLANDIISLYPNNQSSYISKTFFVTYSEVVFNPIPLYYTPNSI